jgi:exo-beta-1,3-glucanase (GH17 family)
MNMVQGMRLGLACLAAAALAIVGIWAWLGAPIAMPRAPVAAGEKLYCLSYAPFHGSQSPLVLGTQIKPEQVERDLTELAQLTDCVRTYGTDFGSEFVPAAAARHGLKVMQGIWLGRETAKNQTQIDTAVALAKRFPGTVRSLVAGNEVLLRGEMTAGDLAATIRSVKSQVTVPVTYADVWEFWLSNPQVAAAVDFITIHILPYWEDFPVAAGQAGAHVDAIRKRVADAFPGKEVLIGEVGWPSHGRMREGALPSPANQAYVIQEVLALAARENFHVNLIEAYDQPWKRTLEGTAGGYWGVLDDAGRRKFAWGEPVSNHPWWRWQAAGGVLFAVLAFGMAFAAARGKRLPPARWLALTGTAVAGGALVGWAIENVPVESLGAGGWLRSLAFAIVALSSAPVCCAAIAGDVPIPRFSRLLGPRDQRTRDRVAIALGAVLMVTTVLAVQAALALVFDPRYKDFPFAPLTAAVAPFLLHTVALPRPGGRRGVAEILAGLLLALSAGYIVLNEGFGNWQSLWFCIALLALAFSLVQVRDAQN